MKTIIAEIIKTIKNSDTVIERDMKLLALFLNYSEPHWGWH